MAFLLISLWGFLNLGLSLFSISKVKKNQESCQFIWFWAFPTGAFVYEDLFVFGLFHAGLAFYSVLSANNLLWLVGFLVFWIVRSAGETLYFFLQQFLVPRHHPHNIGAHFAIIRKYLGNISDQKCFILAQVGMQSVLTLSILSLIYVLRRSNF